MALAVLVISFPHHPPENLDGLKIYVCKDSKAEGLCPWKQFPGSKRSWCDTLSCSLLLWGEFHRQSRKEKFPPSISALIRQR